MRDWIARYGAIAASVGAAMATLGDLGQLWVVNAARDQLSLAPPPTGLIVPATLLGALGIPLYGLGYCALALRDDGSRRRAASVTLAAGLAFAALGGTVHAGTGIAIARDVGGIAAGADPLTGVLRSGSILVSLWVVSALLFLVAAGGAFQLARGWGWRILNPMVLTLVIGAGGTLLSQPWRDFVGPASINIAHCVFFAALAAQPWRVSRHA